MSSENPNQKLILEAVPKLVQLLQPLPPDDRHRVVAAAMILLGDASPAPSITPKTQSYMGSPETSDGISGKARAWMSKNSITRDQLDHIFSIESDLIDVIASRLPGTSKRQQTAQAYVLCGLKTFLLTGEVTFTDKDAREVCQKVGCYDIANHSNYMKAFGNWIGGTKDTGWKLSNPGLNEAAKIVVNLTSSVKTE